MGLDKVLDENGMRLPDSLAGLFRNYVFATIDDEKHYKLVVKTVLAYGTWDQIKWLFQRYGRERVQDIFLDDYFGLQTIPEATHEWRRHRHCAIQKGNLVGRRPDQVSVTRYAVVLRGMRCGRDSSGYVEEDNQAGWPSS